MIDFTKLREKLDPDPGGEDNLRIRTAVVQTMNADGTVDVLLSGALVPGVPRLDQGNWLATGANVQMITLRGGYLILGPTQKGARRVSTYLTNNQTWTGSATYTALSGADIMGVAFTAPPSGAVKVSIEGWLAVSSATLQRRSFMSAWVATGSVINAGAVISAADDERAAMAQNSVASIFDYKYVNVTYPVTGLTPGNPYNATVGVRLLNSADTGAVNKRRVTVEPF